MLTCTVFVRTERMQRYFLFLCNLHTVVVAAIVVVLGGEVVYLAFRRTDLAVSLPVSGQSGYCSTNSCTYLAKQQWNNTMQRRNFY